MVDLVKQLREVEERDFDPASLKTMVLWGADEIERLSMARDQGRVADQGIVDEAIRAATKIKDAEIERLRAERDEATAGLGRLWQAGYNSALMEAADKVRFNPTVAHEVIADTLMKMRRSFEEKPSRDEQSTRGGEAK